MIFLAAFTDNTKMHQKHKWEFRILQGSYLSRSHHAHIFVLFNPPKVIQFTFL